MVTYSFPHLLLSNLQQGEGESRPRSSRLDVRSWHRERGVLKGPALVRVERDNDKAFPLPPGLDTIERELERIVKDLLSSFVLIENYPRCMMQIIVR